MRRWVSSGNKWKLNLTNFYIQSFCLPLAATTAIVASAPSATSVATHAVVHVAISVYSVLLAGSWRPENAIQNAPRAFINLTLVVRSVITIAKLATVG